MRKHQRREPGYHYHRCSALRPNRNPCAKPTAVLPLISLPLTFSNLCAERAGAKPAVLPHFFPRQSPPARRFPRLLPRHGRLRLSGNTNRGSSRLFLRPFRFASHQTWPGQRQETIIIALCACVAWKLAAFARQCISPRGRLAPIADFELSIILYMASFSPSRAFKTPALGPDDCELRLLMVNGESFSSCALVLFHRSRRETNRHQRTAKGYVGVLRIGNVAIPGPSTRFLFANVGSGVVENMRTVFSKQIYSLLTFLSPLFQNCLIFSKSPHQVGHHHQRKLKKSVCFTWGNCSRTQKI